MFVKKLEMYVQYFNEKIEQFKIRPDKRQEKYLNKFSKNLNEGILYYKSIFKNADFINSFSSLEGKLKTF